jgi:hypothetical protein
LKPNKKWEQEVGSRATRYTKVVMKGKSDDDETRIFRVTGEEKHPAVKELIADSLQKK